MRRQGADSCDESIRRLIKKAARRIFADGMLEPSVDKYSVSLPATNTSLPEYYRLSRFADREEYHARLQIYVNVKAIKPEWDAGAGDRGQLSRITLIDPKAASEILDDELPWEVAAWAIESIKCAAKDGLPSVHHIIDAWCRGKAPGAISAERANQLVDSMKVIDAAQQLAEDGRDILLRKLSARLFNDSKRIEALSRPLAFLLGESNEAEEDDVFARLGLVKHPQPMLLCGPSNFSVQIGSSLIPLTSPYIGLRPDTISGLNAAGGSVRRILTIENLASFNEAAEDARKPRDMLLVYIAGNPTPSFLAAYNRILQSLQPSEVMHWGDIDVGGFRIAARLADSVQTVGYRLRLWRMNPLEVTTGQQMIVHEKKIAEVSVICEKYGWSEEAKGLTENPVFQEQEFLDWDPLYVRDDK